jgi:CO/xanthine dehydrogenase FAD-binding subunit
VSVTVVERLEDAYAALEEHPDAVILAGGTDFMVEVNFGYRRPTSVVHVARIRELRGWSREGDEIVLRAGLTYAEMEQPDFRALLPALAAAARTVGSPQIRAAGTLGGNLGTASPAGDTLPVLAALDAVVVIGSREGVRELPLSEFIVGPKRNALAPGELVLAARVPVLRGPQEFLKVGTRNAMVIAVCNVALIVDLDGRSVRCALGSVGPVPLRAHEAEAWVADKVDWEAGRIDDQTVYGTFGRMVEEAARPIDDHRGTAAYRRHAVGVLAARALQRAL